MRGEWLYGDRTDVLTRADARTFMAAWGIGLVWFPVERILAMPALRFEWLNGDLQHPEGQRSLLSAALNLDLTAHVSLLLDLSRDQLETKSHPFSSPPGVFSNSATVFVTQVQLKI